MQWLKVVFLGAFLAQSVWGKGLDLQFSWNKLNYTWGHGLSLSDALSTDDPDVYDTYIYQNNIAIGANKWRNKVFVSVPRRRAGIPSTLNFVWLNGTRHNPPLIPYPNWNSNRMNRNNDDEVHLVSAYRMVVDECDRLWVIDDGRIESFGPKGGIVKIQNPSVVIIDLHTDKIIRRYFFKDTDLNGLTSVVNLAIDVDKSSCHDAYAYIPDMLGYGLIVYSFAKDDSWRVKHRYFFLEPLSGDLTVAGMKFQWMDGVFAVGLSNKNRDGFRTAYFYAMAGLHLFGVSTEVLRNKELATRSYHNDDFKVLFYRGPNTQSSSGDLHKATGVMFFGLINQNGVGCWNTNKPRSAEFFDVIFRDDERFIYPCDLKVTNNELITMSDRFPIYATRGFDFSDINIRIFITNVYDAIKNSNCNI